MAVKQGFPSAPSRLTSAVRTALFTSAAVTAIAVGAPGHNAYAQQVGSCNPTTIENTGSALCSGAFDASIEFDVADMTVVDATTGDSTLSAGDISVVVAEGSTASGIAVTSVTAAEAGAESMGSVTIENHGDIANSGENDIEVDPSLIVSKPNHGIRIWRRTAGENSGYWWGSSVAIDENGDAVGDAKDFDHHITNQEFDSYLNIDPSSADYGDRDNAGAGPVEDLTFISAPEGTFGSGAIGILSAETEAGDIAITNTGDLTAGSGGSITYYSDYRVINATGSFANIDTDGDGVLDTRVYGGRDQVSLREDDIKSATVYAAGIAANSTSGNIAVKNEGTITAGDTTKGIVVETVDGDIAIANSGDISTGDNSIGIHAKSAIVTEYSGVSYHYTASQAYATEYNQAQRSFFGGVTPPSYSHFVREYDVTANTVDTTDSVIAVENSGNISVGAAGTGIKAENPSGERIDIVNSGDISVAEGAGGTGIYASTSANLEAKKEQEYCFRGCTYERSDAYYVESGEANELNVKYGLSNREEFRGEVARGEGTIDFNSTEQKELFGFGAEMPTGLYYTHLQAVMGGSIVFPTPTGEYTEVQTKHYREYVQWTATGYFDDEGDIAISNSGNIDMSDATFGVGIQAVGLGDTAIVNSGDIDVGTLGRGIVSQGAGKTEIYNSGAINLNSAGSAGITVASQHFGDDVELSGNAADQATADAFGGFHNDDTLVINDGVIQAFNDSSELIEYGEAGTVAAIPLTTAGISVSAHNANFQNSSVKFTQYGQGVVDHINASNYARHEADMEAYAAGDIALDEVWEYNKIEIDESVELSNVRVVNSGDIALSDFSSGIEVRARYGDVVVQNSGDISVGDGIHAVSPVYSAFNSNSAGVKLNNFGIEGLANHYLFNTGTVTAGDMGDGLVSQSFHGSSTVVNDGVVTVGDGHIILAADSPLDSDHGRLTHGVTSVTGGGHDAYATAVNNGEINSGDRSIGMVASNAFTTGAFISDEFGHDFTASAINSGIINTGDNSIGILLNGYTAMAYNSGSITVGGGHVQDTNLIKAGAGMSSATSAAGNATGLMHVLVNAGEIRGGDQMIGVHANAVTAYAIQQATGSISLGSDTAGLVAIGQSANAQNAGIVTTGDSSSGMVARGDRFATLFNSGQVSVGDDSIGAQAFGVLARVQNSGTISAGDNSTAVRLSSAIINQVDPETGEVLGQLGGYVQNQGTISAGHNGIAIESTEDYAASIINSGVIEGSIVMGNGDDLLYNAVQTDENGYAVGAGRIVLNDASIDMGEGVNTFRNVFGDIAFSGESVIDLGTAGVMQNYSSGESYVSISSMDGTIGDTLTINGDVNFTTVQGNNGLLLVDTSSMGSDSIVINGDLTVDEQLNAAGDTKPSNLRVGMNVLDQGKGQQTAEILTVNGEQKLDNVVLAGLGGDFADTIVNAEMQQDANGNWVIAYTSGLSNLGAAASSVSHLAEGFWMRSATAFQDSERAVNASEYGRVAGFQMWTTGFHTDSDVDSQGDVAGQKLGFTQLLSGSMVGATYSTKLGGSWLSVSPIVGYGSADGSQMEQQSSSALNTKSLALSGTWSMADFYASAIYQKVDFDAFVSAAGSRGNTSGKAHGFSLEAGWNYVLDSGIALTPFAQWNDVKVEMDAFTSSDGNFDYAYDLGNSKRARLGMNLSKSFKFSDGVVMPYATVSVLDTQNANNHDLYSNGVAFSSDVSGQGFNLDFGVDGRFSTWSVKGGLGVHSGDVDKNGLSASFSITRNL
ncbi:autotransporter outer membrane beta-barrel domain-containing protein [Microbulbifer sp. SAOS-129_SWC]|uniref:autotransporter outer membrane beta-barrel domain-containing protein n=1 Tax=Microbulbifer sp. SAOS-129_SWC TaxID=3145235 RepID=UPI0032164C6E